jgi:dipeptidyl aminopeptidase/acylaminoacyl peptidase
LSNTPLAFCLTLLVAAFSVAAEQDAGLTRLRELREVTRYGGAAPFLSPDGKTVVYTLPSNGEATPNALGQVQELYVLDVESRQSRQITGKGYSYAPSWSSDGRRLAFISDQAGRPELWVWERESGALVRFPQLEVAYIMPAYAIRPQWSPDGERIYVPVFAEPLPPWARRDPDAKSEAIHALKFPARAQNVSPQADPFGQRFMGFVAIAEAQLSSRNLRRIGDLKVRDYQLAEVLISPDGAKLAVVSAALRAPDDTALPESNITGKNLVVFDLTDRQRRTFKFNDVGLRKLGVAPNSKFIAWSPDSRQLVLSSGVYDMSGVRPEDDLSDLYLVDVHRGKVRTLTAGLTVEGKPARFEVAMPPVWSLDGAKLHFVSRGDLWILTIDEPANIQRIAGGRDQSFQAVLSLDQPYIYDVFTASTGYAVANAGRLDARCVYALTLDMGTGALSLVQLENSRAGRTLLAMRDRRIESAVETSAGGPVRLLIRSSSTLSPNDWYLIDPLAAKGEMLSVSKAVFDRRLSVRERLEWKLPNGAHADGILYLPPGTPREAKMPLLVGIYPGTAGYSRGMSSWQGGDLTHGPELLIERGYAVFMAGLPLSGKRMLDEIGEHLEPALDAAIASGYVDGNRMCVLGQSYGGYGVFSLAAQSNRFKCGIAVNGPADMMLSVLGAHDDVWETGQGRMPGPLWEHRDAYIENSPVYRLAKPKLPLLILTGRDDDTVPPIHSAIMYKALVQHKVPVEHVIYDGCGHSPNYWPQKSLEDYWSRIFGWLDEHLKAEAPP